MDNDIKKLLGKRIKELRLSQNISQNQLAQVLDIDQRRLSAIECGINFPTRNFVKIAKALNVELKELFNFEHLALDSKQKKEFIYSTIERLQERDIDLIYRIVKSLI